MEEEKKRKRKAYLDSFQKDNNGKYVYKGDMYVFQPQERELRREMARLWGLALVMISAQIIAGCVDAPGTGRSFYVLIPYMISLIAGISVCWGLGRMTEGGSSLRAYVYEATVPQIPGRSVFTAVCAGVAVLGELTYVFKNGIEEKLPGFLIFLVLEVAALFAALLIKRQILLMKWEKKAL